MVMAIVGKTNIEYLALPYTHEDESVMDYRADVSDFVFSELTKEGRNIFAPITSCHNVRKKYGLPGIWEYWKELDEQFISICKKVIVLMLPGWEISVGVKCEIELANKYLIPIEYVDPTKYLEKMRSL